MPGFDGTGPMGMGPRTGGGRGFCPPRAGQFSWTNWYGRGAGRGGIPWGGGRGRVFGGGRGRGWYNPAAFWQPTAYPYVPFGGPSPEQEVEFLKNKAAAMEQELEQIRGRLNELLKSKEQAVE